VARLWLAVAIQPLDQGKASSNIGFACARTSARARNAAEKLRLQGVAKSAYF
jgi:hypothetical protein